MVILFCVVTAFTMIPVVDVANVLPMVTAL